MSPLNALEVSDLTVYYGPVRGVAGVNLAVGTGEVVALLGANGAGKSTVLKAISGVVRPRAGTVTLHGEVLGKLPASRRVELGLVHVPEGRRIFGALTVLENLELGGYVMRHRRLRWGRHRATAPDGRQPPDGRQMGDGRQAPDGRQTGDGRQARGGRRQAGRQRQADRLEEVLDLFPLLRPHLRTLAGMLSGGEQQALALARAMMAHPAVLMVDEPSLGLAPQMVDTVYDLLEKIAAGGTSVLLVEQNVALALEIAARAYVLQQGHVVLNGAARDLATDHRVTEAYLGAEVS